MTLKKLLELRTYFLLGGAVCILLGVFTKQTVFMVLTYVVILAYFVLTCIFWKCPHCGKYLGRSIGEYCPHCGEKLEK